MTSFLTFLNRSDYMRFIDTFDALSENIYYLLKKGCYFLYINTSLYTMEMKTNSFQESKILGNYTMLPNQALGKGATGTVYKGFQNTTKQPVAIKAIDLSSIRDEATKSLLENEKAGLRAVKAPNVMRLEDIIEDQSFCYIITELCQGSTLQEYLKKKLILSEKEAMSIFRKLTAGCSAISQQCVIHRDMKPANVMIDDQGEIKIIDFGYCEVIMAKRVMKTFNVGSPSYMAPEAYQRTLYSQKSDAWSLGVMLYQMLHGATLDDGMDIRRFFQELKSDPNYIQKKMAPHISPEIKQIIQKALKYQTQERSSVSNLKYLADKYHVNLRQKNPNNYQSVREVAPVHQEIGHKHVTALQFKHEMQSLNRQESENQFRQTGFVSYGDFVRDSSQKGGFMKMKQMTSLDDFDADSRRSNNGSRGVAVDERLNAFLQNSVRSSRSMKPSSMTNISAPLCRTQIVSIREMPNVPLPHYPPLKKHVTVRFN